MRPRVSVVIPVFNQQRYIVECVQSALSQTFLDREVVVVDDGSIDRTPRLLDGFGQGIRLIRQANAGFAPALNRGITESTGTYVAWLSSDDLFLPTKLERQVAYLDAHPEVDLVYTDFYEIDPEGRRLREIQSPWYADRREFRRRMLWNNFVNGSSILMRRAAIDAVGGFPTWPRFQADGIMWFRLLSHGRFGRISAPLTSYRLHPGQGSHYQTQLQREMRDYYRLALALFTIEDLFGDRQTSPTWFADAHHELGDILAYRHLDLTAISFYLRAFTLGAPRSSVGLSVGKALIRATRRAISNVGPALEIGDARRQRR